MKMTEFLDREAEERAYRRIVAGRWADPRESQRVIVNGRARSFEGNDLSELKRLGVVERDAADVI